VCSSDLRIRACPRSVASFSRTLRLCPGTPWSTRRRAPAPPDVRAGMTPTRLERFAERKWGTGVHCGPASYLLRPCSCTRAHALSCRPSTTGQHADGREVQDGGGVPECQRCGASCAVRNPLTPLAVYSIRGAHPWLQCVCLCNSPALGRCAARWSLPRVPERAHGAAGRHGAAGPK